VNQTFAIPVSLAVLVIVALATLAASNSGFQSFTSGTDRIATDAVCSTQIEDVCGSSSVLQQIDSLDQQCRQSLADVAGRGRCSAVAESESLSQRDVRIVAQNPELVN
jgi:hypothetical protein